MTVTTDPDGFAGTLIGDPAVQEAKLTLREGVVTAVDVALARVSVDLGDSGTPVPNAEHLSNYRPSVGDKVKVLVAGPKMYVLDRVGALGPSVIEGAATDTVVADESRSSTSWGNLATVGPQITATISPSGRCLIGVCCGATSTAASDGGQMGFFMSGANVLSGVNGWEAFINYIGTVNSYVSASKVSLLTGLNPGATTFTAKYATLDGNSVHFAARSLWVVPL